MDFMNKLLENSNFTRYFSTVIVPAIGDTLIMVLSSAIFWNSSGNCCCHDGKRWTFSQSDTSCNTE